MSHTNPVIVARDTFRSTLLDLELDFEINHRLIKGIENPGPYFDNVERILKCAAYDAAVEAVAKATKTLKLEKINKVMREAGLIYRPTRWTSNGTARTVEWATVEVRSHTNA